MGDGVRVVLDAYWWSRGTQSLRGTVHGLVDAWAERFPDDEIIIVTRRGPRSDFDALPVNVRPVTTRIWPQALSAMFVVPWVARRAGADAMLSQNFSPLFGRGRSVFVHDAIFATNPEWFTARERAYFRWMLTSSRRAQVLFSSTSTEAARLRTHAHAQRVVPVGLGLGDLVTHPAEEPFAGLRSGSFFLTVGRLNARKNLATTLEGVRESGRMSADKPLVIVGEREGLGAELPTWVDQAIDRGEVRLTGFVDVPSLRWMLRHCSVFISLSLDEGFGIPPVEARALGAPVLVSDRPVFRETLGQEATFVDPLSPTEVGRAVAHLDDTCPDRTPSEVLTRRHSWGRTVDLIRSVVAPQKTERAGRAS